MTLKKQAAIKKSCEVLCGVTLWGLAIMLIFLPFGIRIWLSYYQIGGVFLCLLGFVGLYAELTDPTRKQRYIGVLLAITLITCGIIMSK